MPTPSKLLARWRGSLSRRLPAALLATAAPWAGVALAAGAADASLSCKAQSAATAPTVVELYTSEGCSSCPPADRWLSTLKGRPDVLALAFHVNYWDRLGWTDRFATPEATARQTMLAHQAGESGVYTPQVIVDGQDWRQWPRLPKPASTATATATAIGVTLVREGGMVTAQVAGASGSSSQLAGYWAVLEDYHESKVRAGENAGETLRHDHVVRLYKPVATWSANLGTRVQLAVSQGVPQVPRRVVFVVTDAATARPLQAVALGC
jgi:hypothetical protein